MSHTASTPLIPPSIETLVSAAQSAGLAVRAAASWPETADDRDVPPLAGFVESTFSPLVAAIAQRVLDRSEPSAGDPQVTAVVLVTGLGDVTSAVHVAEAVDTGQRVRPLLFFQSVPNAVAGYVAARHQLTGPIVCLASHDAGLATAALLLADGDADAALVVWLDVAGAAADRDRAAAVLVAAQIGSEP